MAQDNEEIIAEARRKALRNGEEDPVVVAQRYLNIYRQMHIFSPDRKEAFNKMLLELPPNITTIFSALPGGLMLQDYLNDLAEKNGQAPIKTSADKDDTLEAASVSPQPQPQPQAQIPQNTTPQPQVQFVQSGNVDLSLGKDFAQQLAGAFDNVLTRQGEIQRDSLEKISAGLSKNQITLAQYINQSKEAQQQNFSELLNVLAQKSTANTSAPTATALPDSSEKVDNVLLQEVIANQKEISSRLSKVESTALNGENNNQELINALVKSNAEMIETVKNTSAPVATQSINTEELLKLIEQTQSQLIEGVVGRILQNNILNSNQSAASNNNANNIQINTPDTSAQTLMLVNKITDLQASNEKNMEEAISRLITAQKEIYENISAAQSKEIAQAIVNGLQSASLTFNNYAPPSSYSPTPPITASETPLREDPVTQYYQDDLNSLEQDNEADESPVEEMTPIEEQNIITQDNVKKKKKKKKKKEKKVQSPSLEPVKEEWHIAKDKVEEENSFDDNFFNPDEEFEAPSIPDEPINTSDSWDNLDDSEEGSDQITNGFSFKEEVPQPQMQEEKTIENIENSDSATETAVEEPKDYQNIAAIDGASWGFDEENIDNDLSKAQEDVQEEDNLPAINSDQYEEVEMIGSGSNIYSDDLSKQVVGESLSPIIYNKKQVNISVCPQIFDDVEDDKDPYIK